MSNGPKFYVDPKAYGSEAAAEHVAKELAARFPAVRFALGPASYNANASEEHRSTVKAVEAFRAESFPVTSTRHLSSSEQPPRTAAPSSPSSPSSGPGGS